MCAVHFTLHLEHGGSRHYFISIAIIDIKETSISMIAMVKDELKSHWDEQKKDNSYAYNLNSYSTELFK